MRQYGLAKVRVSEAKESTRPVVPGKSAYTDRIAFGVWVNDVRSLPRSLDEWPSPVLDDVTVESIIRTFDVQAQVGYNIVDIFGLFATFGWPVNLADAVDKERDLKVRKIIKAAHQRGLKILYGLGVYSWGFDEIIKHDPAVQGSSIHAMCASSEQSFKWQKKIVDFVLQYDFDGFHLESADLGRCSCQRCKEKWPIDAAYHNYITSRTADYIRSRIPKAYLSVILLNWSKWGEDFSGESKDQLVELSKNVNCLFDQGHRQTYLPKEKRKAFIERLHCNYGTSGGNWAYPPHRWNRLRWFLPYTNRTGTHMKELYADGGRGIMYYQGLVNNPGVEVNIAFGGRIMCNVDRNTEDVLAEVLEDIYKPKSSEALKKLVGIFRQAENCYFEQWDYDRILKADKMPPPGELHLCYLMGSSPSPVLYMQEPFLTTQGRAAYKKGLMDCLKNIEKIEKQFNDNRRIERIKTCLVHALTDVNTIAYAKGERDVWYDAGFVSG